MSAERSNRSPSGRPPGKGKPGASSGGRSNGRSGGGRSGSGHSGSGHSGGGQRGAGRQSKGDKFTPKWRESLDQPVTAAQKRAAEVDKRRGGPRPPRDPDADRRWAEERVTEEWIDEGARARGRVRRRRAGIISGAPSAGGPTT